jgi:hypothetical protein
MVPTYTTKLQLMEKKLWRRRRRHQCAALIQAARAALTAAAF